jgi:DNA-binding MarR family transcriptional regulator
MPRPPAAHPRAAPAADPAADLVAPGTHAARFLAAVRGRAVGGAELRGVLGTDETQVSRTGRRLLDAGLVTRRKVGRQVWWELSPRGERAIAAADGPPRRPPWVDDSGLPGTTVEWWRELQRTAWRAPAGGHDSGDPVGDRILGATLELHVANGILETTWPQIATRAGVPVAEVADRYATVEDLVPACGAVATRHLHMPPPEDAASLFAGQDARERLETLVAIVFGLHDRAAPAVARLRNDAGALPVLGRAHQVFEESLDGVIAAALGALPDPATLALVRALTDVPVWRAVRAGDLGDEVAVAALAGALAGRPAGVARG